MIIEQKNSLFIIALVLAVLLVVAGAGFLLTQNHVKVRIGEDLDRAQKVLMQVQKNRFDNLLSVARSVRDEPGFVAAIRTADIVTVGSELDELYPRPGADFMAVYLESGPGGVAGTGNKSHKLSPQTLSSEGLTALVRSLNRSDPVVFGHALLDDGLLQLAAVAVKNPLGEPAGTLLVGKRFAQMDVENLRRLVYADIAIFQGKRLLASTIKGLKPSLHLVNKPPATGRQGTLEIGHDRYSIRIISSLNQPGSKQKPIEIVLAANHSRYWSPYKALGETALYLSAMMLLLVGVFGVAMSRRFLTGPIQLLERAIQAVAGGNMKIQVSVKRNDELGQLGESFNTMLGALNSSRGELERNRQRFRDFASSSSDWLWETDRSGHFTFVSSSVSETLNMSAAAWLGRTPAEVFPCSNLGALTRLLRPAGKAQCSLKDAEIWVHALSGEAHCLRLNGVPVFSEKTFKGYRGTARDITKLKRDEKRMVVLTNQDHLTGLSNRRRFMEELDHEIRRVERNGQLGVLLLIDLDHLKQVNDTFGHSTGDAMLIAAAEALSGSTRECDIVARVGGDEFAILAVHCDQTTADDIVERLNESLSKANVRASIGVASRESTKTLMDAWAQADSNMYRCKRRRGKRRGGQSPSRGGPSQWKTGDSAPVV